MHLRHPCLRKPQDNMVLDLTLLYLKEEECKKHAGVTGQSVLILVIVFPRLGWILMRFKSSSQYKIFLFFKTISQRPHCCRYVQQSCEPFISLWTRVQWPPELLRSVGHILTFRKKYCSSNLCTWVNSIYLKCPSSCLDNHNPIGASGTILGTLSQDLLTSPLLYSFPSQQLS